MLKGLVPQRLRELRYEAMDRIRPIVYGMGRTVECPCCQKYSAAFLPHGRPQRQGARCPHCSSLERHRLILYYLRKNPQHFGQQTSILHFAPELALGYALDSFPGVRRTTADLYESADLKLDITAMDLDDACFDAIVCSHVLEHVPDDAAAMKELVRVLRPGGWAILQVPLDLNRAETYEDWSITDPAARRNAFGQEDHVRWYGRDFGTRLKAVGFHLNVFSYDKQLREIHGFEAAEDLYIVRKPQA